MDKRGFKVGDRVKLKEPKKWSVGGIGIITGFDIYIRVKWENGGHRKDNFPHLPRELEHAIKVGQQLEFNFMRRE